MDYRVNEKSRFWLLTAATLLALGLNLALGRWQLSRAAEKQGIQSQIEAREKMPPITGTELLAAAQPSALLHRTVRLQGRWLADKTLFLDNRPMQGKVGFYVVTPFLPEGAHALLLVQRGWMPRNFNSRDQLPPLQTATVLLEITGRIAPPPARLYELGVSETGAIRQNLDMAAFSEEIRQPLIPVSIVQTGAPSEGLMREWPAINSGVDKHYGYAFQWFGLAALITILYVWFQIVRKFISPKKT
jgi:surfeit locus 1 family protein